MATFTVGKSENPPLFGTGRVVSTDDHQERSGGESRRLGRGACLGAP